VQPGLLIKVLPRKPQMILNGSDGNIRPAKWQIIRGPHCGPAGIGHLLGRAQMVVVIVGNRPIRSNLRQGLALEPDICLDQDSGGIGLCDEPAGEVIVKHLINAIVLFYPLPSAVVEVVGRIDDARGRVGGSRDTLGGVSIRVVQDLFRAPCRISITIR